MIPSYGNKYFRQGPCEQNARDSAKLSLQRQREVGISIVLTALMPPLQRQIEGGINVVSTTLLPTYYCLWQRWCHVSGFHFPFPLETEAHSTHTDTWKKELTENGNFHCLLQTETEMTNFRFLLQNEDRSMFLLVGK
jgi:hypothetical protein